MENIVSAYIDHLAKFLGLMSYDSKDIFKKCTLSYVLSRVLCTVLCTHRDVTDLEIQGMVNNTKTLVSRKLSIIFLRNKRIHNLYLTWHILRSYHFLVEVTFNDA